MSSGTMFYWMVTMRCRRSPQGEESKGEISTALVNSLTMALGQPVTVEHHAFEVKTLISATSAWVAQAEAVVIINRQLVRHRFPEWPAEYINVYKY